MYNCVECDKSEKARYMNPTKSQMIERQLCFGCNFWTEKLEIRDDSNTVRVKGVHYIIGPEKLKNEHKLSPYMRNAVRGHGGAKFMVYFNDGRIVETNNLWCQGDIPDGFRDRLPDNATFLNSDERGKATDKAKSVKDLLETFSGVSRDEAVCSTCQGAVSMDSFRNELSRKEFRISRMCQPCQDSVFK